MGIETAILAATLASTASTVYSSAKQSRMQKRAGQQAARQAEQAQRQADREFNRANQKRPDVSAMLRRNRAAGSGGVGGTFLTGQAGAPVSAGMLGRTTLLGS
jgi:type II secretory pathway pseudopilin PulG